MGDGYITNVGGGTAAFCANMTNKTFLDWLYSELSPHSSSVRLAQSAEDSAKSNRDNGYNPDAKVENYRDIYSYRMITHPKINEIYERWYSGGDKVYPSDLELTPMRAKMWYVGDGGLNWGADSRRPSVGIAAVNEEDRNDNTRRMFRDAGFDPSVDGRYIRFNQSDTKRFLDWMGEPPDGFEYKWEQGSRDRYLDLKEEAYMNGELPLEKRRDTQGVGVLEDW